MIGLDTVRVGIPKGASPLRLPAWGRWTSTSRPRALKTPWKGLQEVFLARDDHCCDRTGVRASQREDGSGWIEASLPRYVTKAGNTRPLDCQDAPEAVSSLLSDLGVDPLLIPVRRADVAGDWFGPVSPWRAAALSARWPRSRSMPQAEIWSTTIGRHGHNQLVIYDKGVESGLESPDCHGRCEVRAHTSLPIHTVEQLASLKGWWVDQVSALGAPSPLPGISATAKDQFIAHACTLHPELVPTLDAYLRMGSKSSLARMRRLLRQARPSGLGSDLVEMCLAA